MLKIIRATPTRVKWALGLLKAVANMSGSNGVQVKVRPGVGIQIVGPGAASRMRLGDDMALAWILPTSPTGGSGWYICEEIEPNSDASAFQTLTGGRKWGVSSDDGDLGEVLHPELAPGLEPGVSEDNPVVLLRRVDWPDHDPLWAIMPGGDSLPAGAGQYKVLQLDADDEPHWDWVRAHA